MFLYSRRGLTRRCPGALLAVAAGELGSLSMRSLSLANAFNFPKKGYPCKCCNPYWLWSKQRIPWMASQYLVPTALRWTALFQNGITGSVVTLISLMLAHALLGEPLRAMAAERRTPLTCTYDAQTWNVALKRSVNGQRVVQPYTALSTGEIDPVTGCTVCSEDQEIIDIPPLAPFSVCYKLAPQVRAVLTALVWQGQPLFRVDGYRVIRSRGPLDGTGNRTVFSNHAYGAALDINAEQNGLYDQCLRFGPGCRLLRGGEWRPGVPGTLEKDGMIVKALLGTGFRWGGEMEGNYKDFMHFSLTGY